MTAIKMRPTRRLRSIREMNVAAEHLDHYRFHLDSQLMRLPVEVPLWEGGMVAVTLGGPWKNRKREKVLAAWGVPAMLDNLPSLVHLPEGGWGVFEIPSMPDVYSFMVKAAKAADSVLYLDVLAHIVLFSRMTLSEAFSVAMDCVRLDPFAENHPQQRANDWALLGAAVVNVWEARTNTGAHVGDAERVARLMHELLGMLSGWSIRQAELELATRRARLTKGTNSWTS